MINFNFDVVALYKACTESIVSYGYTIAFVAFVYFIVHALIDHITDNVVRIVLSFRAPITVKNSDDDKN
jgi:hypothetical protein